MLLEKKNVTATSLGGRRKLLHTLNPVIITYVQPYHETKIHIIVNVIMERRKLVVTQRWEENSDQTKRQL